MKQADCDIIRDLMPSYLDGICSDATGKYVEEHIAVCTDCKKTLEVMQNTVLSAKQAENRAIDAVKKFRQNLRYRSCMSVVLLGLLLLAVVVIVEYQEGTVSAMIYAAALPVFLTATSLLGTRPPAKMRIFWCAGSAVLLFGGIFLMYYSLIRIRDGGILFGLADGQVGRMIDGCLLTLAFLQGALYVCALIGSIRTGSRENVLCGCSLTGMFLMLSYHSMLRMLSDFAVFEAELGKTTGIFLGLGVLATLILSFRTDKKIFYS